MSNINIHLMCGIPASGKTTWINAEVARQMEENRSAVRVSRDDIRKVMIGDGEYFSKEKEVFKAFIDEINECIKLGFEDIYIDATHINKASRHKVLSQLKPNHSSTLIIEVMPFVVEKCIEFNNKREGFAKVPEEAIRNMNEKWEEPTIEEFSNFIKPNFFAKVKISHI